MFLRYMLLERPSFGFGIPCSCLLVPRGKPLQGRCSASQACVIQGHCAYCLQVLHNVLLWRPSHVPGIPGLCPLVLLGEELRRNAAYAGLMPLNTLKPKPQLLCPGVPAGPVLRPAGVPSPVLGILDFYL